MYLSRTGFENYLACPRKFQLRTLERRVWPNRPLSSRQEEVLAKGQAFHQLAQRHFNGLPSTIETIEDGQVRRWWEQFKQHAPKIPNQPGVRILPEMSLTIPLPGIDGLYLLTGRFDLVILGESFVHIYDWKTGRPLPESDLRGSWQTRLYLAMLAEGSAALQHACRPDQISMTYWFVQEPNNPRTFTYSQAWHEQNWGEILDIAAQIHRLSAEEVSSWPLTQDLTICRRCPYTAVCERQDAGKAEPEPVEYEPAETGEAIEPELPQ